jgi:dihydrofolate reductase
MRKVIVSEFLTLDGVMEAPEKWVGPFQSAEIETLKIDEMKEVDALLVGASTYQIFADSWPSRNGVLADQMNGIRKYVVTSSNNDLVWNNSRLLRGDIERAVSAVKEQPGEDILVAGSNRLAQTLLKCHLVDELRLLVYPVVLGVGRRLFAHDIPLTLTPLDTKTFDRGVVFLRYAVAGA